MQGLSGPQASGAWRLPRRELIATAVIVAYAIVLLSPVPRELRGTLSGLGVIAAGGVIAVAMVQRARRNGGRRRRAWWIFAVSALFAATANLQLLVWERGRPLAALSPSDLLLVLALLTGIVGLITFPPVPRRNPEIVRMLLDGLIIGGSVLVLLSLTLFPEVLEHGGTTFVLLVPVIDVLIATVTALLFVRSAPGDGTPLGYAAVGFVCFGASDFAYSGLFGGVEPFRFGSIADLGWIAGWTLMSLAVSRDAAGRAVGAADRDTMPEPSPVPGSVLIFSLFLAAAVVVVWHLHGENLRTSSAVLWLVVLLALLARQILLLADNERLRSALERRVRERSRSLLQVTEQSGLLVDSVGDGIYGVDREGSVTFVNPAAARALRYTPEALIGRHAHATFHAVQPDGTPFPAHACYIVEAIRDRVVTNAEEDSYVRSDGVVIPVEVTATPLITDSVAIGAVVVFRDVTQRREVDRLKSEFVSMVSHELRTPLTAIRGSLGLLAGGALGAVTPAAARMVDIALISCERLTRLIDDILDLERIESGVLSLTLDQHLAPLLVEQAVAQLWVLADEASVTVTAESSAAAPDVVRADADRVVQTLVNLIGNAIKFSSPGSTVRVSTTRRERVVEFRIIDEGRGIPPDKLDVIFGRFEQVDSSDARDRGGFGLGLAISRSIIERLGGRIWATNNSGGGATFAFTLPLADPPRSGVAEAAVTARAAAGSDLATTAATVGSAGRSPDA